MKSGRPVNIYLKSKALLVNAQNPDLAIQVQREKRNMSSSSFIPYCYFGVESNQFGLEIDGFEFPVCNIFQVKNHTFP